MQTLMKQLTIGIFHDDNLAKELGKKATESDIILYHRKIDDTIFSFIHAVDDKLSVKTQILGIIDVAILSAESVTPSFGENLLLIDAMKIKHGLILVPPFSDTTPIKNIIKDTSIEQFEIIEKEPHKIMELLQKISIERVQEAPLIITIDHSFPVKGIGEVILGFIQQGVVHTHDKLVLLPTNKEIIVRSIQMQDKNVKDAETGSRVGLAIKGADITELTRGSLLCAPDSASICQTLTLQFVQNKYYSNASEGKFHMTIGMQTIPVSITEIKKKSITFTTDKPFCYTKDDVFLFLNLNAEKLHFIGFATLNEK